MNSKYSLILIQYLTIREIQEIDSDNCGFFNLLEVEKMQEVLRPHWACITCLSLHKSLLHNNRPHDMMFPGPKWACVWYPQDCGPSHYIISSWHIAAGSCGTRSSILPMFLQGLPSKALLFWMLWFKEWFIAVIRWWTLNHCPVRPLFIDTKFI